MANDEYLHWFPDWQERQRRMRELLGEQEPDPNEPTEPPTLERAKETLQ